MANGDLRKRVALDTWHALLLALLSLLSLAPPDPVVPALARVQVWIDTALHDEAAAWAFGTMLRDETRRELGFDVSVGLAWCKPYAKLGSMAAKPPACGLHGALTPEAVRALLEATPISKLSSVSNATLNGGQRVALEKACAAAGGGGAAGCTIADIGALPDAHLCRALRVGACGGDEAISKVRALLTFSHLLPTFSHLLAPPRAGHTRGARSRERKCACPLGRARSCAPPASAH